MFLFDNGYLIKLALSDTVTIEQFLLSIVYIPLFYTFAGILLLMLVLVLRLFVGDYFKKGRPPPKRRETEFD